MTEFEKAVSDSLSKESDEGGENAIESFGDDSLAVDWRSGAKMCTVSISRKKWINYLENCAAIYPDEVQIRYRNKDGSIVAHMPMSYLVLRRPREVTEEQKQIGAETLRKYHANSKL